MPAARNPGAADNRRIPRGREVLRHAARWRCADRAVTSMASAPRARSGPRQPPLRARASGEESGPARHHGDSAWAADTASPRARDARHQGSATTGGRCPAPRDEGPRGRSGEARHEVGGGEPLLHARHLGHPAVPLLEPSGARGSAWPRRGRMKRSSSHFRRVHRLGQLVVPAVQSRALRRRSTARNRDGARAGWRGPGHSRDPSPAPSTAEESSGEQVLEGPPPPMCRR